MKVLHIFLSDAMIFLLYTISNTFI